MCIRDSSWPSEISMMKLAMENNLSETAFIVKEEKGYHLRWFTPGTEVELCGHATLASAYVILNFYEQDKTEVTFSTLSGKLIVKQNENLYEMDFPTYELKEVPVTDDMEKAFGARPIKAVLGLDLICVCLLYTSSLSAADFFCKFYCLYFVFMVIFTCHFEYLLILLVLL